MDRFENFKIQVAIVVIGELVALFALYAADIDGVVIWPMILLVLFNLLIFVWIISKYENDKKERYVDISRILGHDAKDALVFGEVGIITYDDQYNITWVNDFFSDRDIDIVGGKATAWISDIASLFSGDVDEICAESNGRVYEILRKENAQVLYVKDVSEYVHLKEKYDKDGIVAGLLQLDNYLEVQQYEDESRMSTINMSVRQPIIEWANKYGMFIRRLRSDRYLVIMNEAIFEKVQNDHFDLLNTVRKNADEIDVPITCSMSFARGSEDFQQLDTMINDLMELAQSRGGDQVAVKKYNEDVKFFGSGSEAKEKRSKVRVRVMSQAIKEAVIDAKRVFISGHKNMDFDCMGSALCVSRLVQAHRKEAYIISNSGGIEPQLFEAYTEYREHLADRHKFISDEEAVAMMDEQDLLIVVDYHSPQQSGAPLAIEKANRKIIIDHHRRNENLISSPLLVYVEPSASSTCELVTEFLPYQNIHVDISEQEATLMYVGILVDTNRFKMRTGSRTFEVAARLKNMGVDPITAENMLKESFDDFETKTAVLKFARQYENGIVIAAVDPQMICTRTLMSQVADTLLSIKAVEASFVVANVGGENVAISARSKGIINVQLIMEKMNGGGHFSAAALQRPQSSVAALEQELKATIQQYFEENMEE